MNNKHSKNNTRSKTKEPMIFSSDEEELNYVNNYFQGTKNFEIKEPVESIKYAPIQITEKEEIILIHSLKYNDNHITLSKDNEKLIKSLCKKGIIKKSHSEKSFVVKKNVDLLFDVERNNVFGKEIKRTN